MALELVTYGDPVLRVRATPVDRVTPDWKRLVDGMMETMYTHSGVGLAAQQVGQTIAVCVIDIPPDLDVDKEGGVRLHPDLPMPLVMFNPEIVARTKALERADEGCLSFPGIHTGVQRSPELTVAFTDWKGERRTLSCRGLLARAVQHELDHLNGVLLVDRMSSVKKISLAGALKRLREETEARKAKRQAPPL